MQAPIPLAIVSGPDLVYEFANDIYRRISRMPDPIGTAFGATGHSTVPGLREKIERVYHTGEPYTLPELPLDLLPTPEEPNRRAYYHLAYHALRDEAGRVDGVILSSVDITAVCEAREREAAQLKEFAELRSRIHALVGAAPLTLWAIDHEGRFTVFEGGMMLEPQPAVGSSVWGRYPPVIEGYHRRALAGEHIDVTIQTPGRWLQVAYRPQVAEDGSIVGALGVATDITERRRAEEERERLASKLLQVQKLESLGVLAGGIAHDFNNILTAIMGNAALALMRLPSGSAARQSIDDVVASARRAADLTRQLLAYSGKAHFDVRPIDLSAHVREIAHLLEASIAKKVQLRLELADDLPATLADVAQVQQIVMNLVINGAEAVGTESGTVLVTTGVQNVDVTYAESLGEATTLAPGLYVFLEVHDTGSGIDEATREKMFDPFFTTKFHGRGLGLAAVLGIVRGHQGAIKVYSQVGRGTTFKVLLPASEQVAASSRRSPAASFHGSGLVLFADDEPAIRRTGRQMLEHFGFTVVEAADGREAVRIFEERKDEIVAIILDMTMPEMSGEEAFREVRRIRPDVVVILSSGYNEVEATRRFTSKGLAGFLQKPYSPEDLAAKLSAALG